MDGLQRDLFDDTTYYYDWHRDVWNLGQLLIAILVEGDTFEGGGKTWFILGRGNNQSFTIMEESVFRAGIGDKMRKEVAQKNINYILKELLESKDCVSAGSVVHMDGHLYEDVVKDIETYLDLSNE